MCGIAGIIRHNGHRLDEQTLSDMTLALRHRGPDDGGIHMIRHSDIEIGLGHRRLSIIDLSESGHQPMTNEDGTLWITYNGEIYNFREIKDELIRYGHVFSSDTDTEVIIHGYEQYGIEILKKINGMFAFGLWDDRKRQLFLARDRYGKKPVYYQCSKGGLIFASELKSLLKHSDIKREIDLKSLSRYLLCEYVPAPFSIIKDIFKVPAGHYLTWQAGSVSILPYWQIRFDSADQRALPDEFELEGQLIDLLRKSVERRLVSDVPLGVFLSGGIDSSSIVALMAELIPSNQIKTFSIGFEDRSFDESNYARRVAKLFGTDHHEKVFTPTMMLDTLPDVWDFLDEPFADASVLPTYMLSKFTREFVTVALGGDGGDEIFAGYDPFLAHRAADLYQGIPTMIRDKVLAPLFNALPVSTKNMSFDFRIKQFLKGIPYPPAIRNQIWLGSFDMTEQKKLFTHESHELLADYDPYSEIHQSCRGVSFRDSVDQLIYVYCRYYLGEDILTKVDRASMAASLEVRAPYLDREFVECVNRLPSKFKLHGLIRKYLLKKSLQRKLPGDILHRKKKGFGIPLAEWLKGELKPILLDVFSPARIRREGLFDVGMIETLLREHFSGEKDNRKPIWTLLMFEMWRERFVASY
jgi:asparagine synthase (glutamine-hydrolysing)